MTDQFESLVSTAWLADHIGTPGVYVLDASRHLPAARRDPVREFEEGHILGARFLDLATLTDGTAPVPAALPRPEQVAQRLAELGVEVGARIVLYDDSPVKTAARAWFALTHCGVANVAVLDGGLSKWRAEGRHLETGPETANALESATPAAASSMAASPKVVTKADMLINCDSGIAQVLDARGADRVFGSGIDPVHGGQNGRIPGALNLPFGAVFNEDGTFKSAHDLRALFEDAGVDLSRRLITTCGSGVTACVLLLAAHIAGIDDVQLYDGSWQEWEADPDTPKLQGPA